MDIASLQIQLVAESQEAISQMNSLEKAFSSLNASLSSTSGFSRATKSIASLSDSLGRLSASTQGIESATRNIERINSVVQTLSSSTAGIKAFVNNARQLGFAFSDIGSAASSMSSIAGGLQNIKLDIDADSIDRGTSSLYRISDAIDSVSQSSAKMQNFNNQILDANYALTTFASGFASLNIDTSGFDSIASDLQKLVSQLQSVGPSLNSIKTLGDAFQSLGGNAQAFSNAIPIITNSLRELITEFNKLPAASKNVTQTVNSISKLLSTASKYAKTFDKTSVAASKHDASMNKISNANKKAEKSFGGVITKMYSLHRAFAAFAAAKHLGQIFGKFIEQSIGFTENVNLFSVATGTASTKLWGFIETMNSAFALDTSELAKTTGLFYQLANGIGQTSKNSEILSRNMAQLATDISSFYNISVESATEKLQAGLSGMAKPLRELGIDITQASLAQTALANGITKSVRSLDQATKQWLIYETILRQSSKAQGDFARTLSTPANQLKMLQQQFQSLSRAIGNLFYNVLGGVLPIINKVIQAVTILIQRLGALVGYKPPKVGGFTDLGKEADDATASIGGTGKALKKLKDYTMGFDELHIIAPEDDEGGGGGAGGAVSDLETAFSEYDNLMDMITGATNDFLAAIEKAFSTLKGYALPTIESLERLWDALKILGTFSGQALYDFYDRFLRPVAIWTLGEGIPRFVDAITNMIREINWDYLRTSLQNVWDALAPFAVTIGEGLLWFWENVLVPLAGWVIGDALPVFLNLVASAIEALDPILKGVGEGLKYIWDYFLKPAAKWTGGAIIDFMKWLKEGFEWLAEWAKNNKDLIADVTKWVGNFILAFSGYEILTKAAKAIQGFIFGKNAIEGLNSIVAIGKGTTKKDIQNAAEAMKELGEGQAGVFDRIKNFVQANWVGLLIAAIGALTLAAVEAFNQWKDNEIAKAFGDISLSAEQCRRIIEPFTKTFTEAADEATKYGNATEDAAARLESAADDVEKSFEKLKDVDLTGASGALKEFNSALEDLKKLDKGVFDEVKTAMESMGKDSPQFLQFLQDKIVELKDTAPEVATALQNMANNSKTYLEQLQSSISGLKGFDPQLQKDIDNLVTQYGLGTKALSEALTTYRQSLGTDISPEAQKALEDIQKLNDKLLESNKPLTDYADAVSKLVKSVSEYTGTISNEEMLKKFGFSQSTIDAIQTSANNITATYTDFQSKIDKLLKDGTTMEAGEYNKRVEELQKYMEQIKIISSETFGAAEASLAMLRRSIESQPPLTTESYTTLLAEMEKKGEAASEALKTIQAEAYRTAEQVKAMMKLEGADPGEIARVVEQMYREADAAFIEGGTELAKNLNDIGIAASQGLIEGTKSAINPAAMEASFNVITESFRKNGTTSIESFHEGMNTTALAMAATNPGLVEILKTIDKFAEDAKIRAEAAGIEVPEEFNYGLTKGATKAKDGAEALKQYIVEQLVMAQPEMFAVAYNSGELVGNSIADGIAANALAAGNATVEVIDGVERIILDTGFDFAPQVNEAFNTELKEGFKITEGTKEVISKDTEESAKTAAKSAESPSVVAAAGAAGATVGKKIGGGVKDELDGVDLTSTMDNVADTLSDTLGSESNQTKVKDSAATLGDATLSGLMFALSIASPSKATEEIGGFAIEGLSDALEAGKEQIKSLGIEVGKQVMIGMNEGIRAVGSEEINTNTVTIWQTIGTTIKNIVGDMKTFIISAVDEIKYKITYTFEEIMVYSNDFMLKMFEAIKIKIEELKVFLSENLLSIVENFKTSYSEINTMTETAMNQVYMQFYITFSDIFNFTEYTLTEIINGMEKALNSITALAEQMKSAVAGVGSAQAAVVEGMTEMFSASASFTGENSVVNVNTLGIPGLATGGIAKAGSVIRVNEGGKIEGLFRHNRQAVVANNDDIMQFASEVATNIAGGILASSSAQGGSIEEVVVPVTVNLDGNVLYTTIERIKAQKGQEFSTGEMLYGY